MATGDAISLFLTEWKYACNSETAAKRQEAWRCIEHNNQPFNWVHYFLYVTPLAVEIVLPQLFKNIVSSEKVAIEWKLVGLWNSNRKYWLTFRLKI